MLYRNHASRLYKQIVPLVAHTVPMGKAPTVTYSAVAQDHWETCSAATGKPLVPAGYIIWPTMGRLPITKSPAQQWRFTNLGGCHLVVLRL